MKYFLFFILGLMLSNTSSAQHYLTLLHEKGLIDTQFLQKPEIVWNSLWHSSLNKRPMVPLQMSLPELDIDCYNFVQSYNGLSPENFNTTYPLAHIFPSLYCEKRQQPYVFFHSYRIDTVWDAFETETLDPNTYESIFRKNFTLVSNSILDSFDNARFEEAEVRCSSEPLYERYPDIIYGYSTRCKGEIDGFAELLSFQHWAYLDTLLQVKSYPAALEILNEDSENDDEYFFNFVVPIYPLPKILDSLNIIWAGRVTIIEKISKFKSIQTDSSPLFQARQKQSQKIWKDALGNTLVPQKLDSSEVTQVAFLYDFYLERNGKFYASCLGSAALADNDPFYFVYYEPIISDSNDNTTTTNLNKKSNTTKRNKKKSTTKSNEKTKKNLNKNPKK